MAGALPLRLPHATVWKVWRPGLCAARMLGGQHIKQSLCHTVEFVYEAEEVQPHTAVKAVAREG
eukprot:3333566-Alexandrium_andersonii.AAC.1